MRYRSIRKKSTKLQYNLQHLMAKHAVRSGSHLARELNIPPPTINRIIAGQVLDPRCSTLVLLADYFDVSIDQLVGREEIDWSKYQ